MDHDREPSPGLCRLLAVLEYPAQLIGNLAAWLLLPLTGALVYEVVSRYLFNNPTIWAYDMTYMLSSAVFMLGAAYALQKGSHVRADFLLAMLKPRWQALLDAAMYLVLYFPAMILFFVVSLRFARQSWMQHELYPQSPWMPPIYPLKAVIPLTILLLLLQGVAELIKVGWVIRHNTAFKPEEPAS
ncbi:MAG: TRAP transporter small permease subunit [Castellaniella sp.]|uniref:TRAP transporter small permease subunit n=1 Tax=Castellaniella sp. TaxID=1955812 RepID=UPI003A8995D2